MQTMSTLHINAHSLQQIIDHAVLGYPYEVCGLAGGQAGRVEVVTQIPNASLTPLVSFEMERQAMVDVIMGFQRAGREVVAVYHSHPNEEAIPSQRDIAQATWPDAIYIIVGLHDLSAPVVRAWTVRREFAEPIEAEIVIVD